MRFGGSGKGALSSSTNLNWKYHLGRTYQFDTGVAEKYTGFCGNSADRRLRLGPAFL